jgi:hypothetical protein
VSTRSVIARVGEHEGEFSGVYHHWDGAPTSLGTYLWNLLHGHFKNDLGKMLRTLLDQHSSWSTIVHKDFNVKPGYTNVGTRLDGMSLEEFLNQPLNRRPQCHWHGHRHEKNEPYTQTSLEDGTDIEWLYVFDEIERKMFIRDVSAKEDVAIIDMNGDEPNWTLIQCGENFERCSHYAWAHGLTPKTSNLSTQTWLERRPLDLHDAIAFVINGKRLTNSGSGGDADFLSRTQTTRFPSGTWVQSLIAGNGKRMDIPVAKRTNKGFVPLAGVQWVFPPTKNNPQETIMEAK